MLGLLLLLGAAAAALYFRPDLMPIPRGQLGSLTWGAESPPVAVATPAPVQESDPPSVAEVSSPTAPDMTAEDVAAAWVERWNAGDFAGLYDLTSGTVQRSISRDDFVARYQGIAQRAELRAVHAEIDPGADVGRRVPITVTFDSGIAGAFEQQNVLLLAQENLGWRVAWTPAAIFRELGADGCVDIDRLPSSRGAILDRHGEPLAYDGTVERVGVVPEQIPPEQAGAILEELSDLTDTPVADIERLTAQADPTWFVPIKDFPAEEKERLLDIISRLPGVSVKSEVARVYPLAQRAAHITGYIAEPTAEQIAANPELIPGQPIGQAGIEAGADEILAGVPGGRIIVVECNSRVERATVASRDPVPPRDVVLTIDRAFQMSVFDALKAQGPPQGAGVVLDPRDGQVLALASIPSYDPNGFVIGFTDRERTALQSESQRPLLSRAAEGAYPTGSAFKPITFAAAMEGLDYTPDTVVECPATFQLDGASQVWEDWTVAYGVPPQGPLTLHQALVNSCNTVFYAIGRDLDARDPDFLPGMAKAFGLGEPTGIPYLPEVGGVVPDPAWKLDTMGDYWATGDAINLSIGQGALQATPLQMATAYAAIANGGELLQPYIVSRVVATDGTEEVVGERVVRRQLPLSESTVRALQDALRSQTSDPNGAGSYRVFGDFAWPIAGKTGTAQRNASATAKPHSWFAGFGPYGAESQITSAVIFESAGEGVSFAAPTTRRIYEAWLGSALPTEAATNPLS